jgi:hypothetical protein
MNELYNHVLKEVPSINAMIMKERLKPFTDKENRRLWRLNHKDLVKAYRLKYREKKKHEKAKQKTNN